MEVRILTAAEVETLLPVEACIPIMAEVLAALARGQVSQPLRTIFRPPGAAGMLVVMPSYKAGLPDRAFFGLKAIGVFPGNPARGKDAHQGAVLLYSGETGELLALMNASAITAIRTAAVSGVATRLLAREDAGNLAIIGTGVQARSHLEAMHLVRRIKRARVASRTYAHARQFAEEQGTRYPFPIEPVRTVEDAVQGADLVVTATTAPQPVLQREWIAPGTHINAVGAFTPTTREIDSATIAAAQVFVDRRESALAEAGDLLLPVQEGMITADHIRAEIGEVILDPQLGRTSAEAITLFKSVGLPVEDLAAAEYIYHRAQESGMGASVPF